MRKDIEDWIKELLQDYTSGSAAAADANNIFNKITINIQNCTKPDGTKIQPVEDVIKSEIKSSINDIKENVNKAIDWAKNEKDVLMNNQIDYSKQKVPHEQITDWLIKKPASGVFPVSSDMYTDGMTNFSRARKNPNADIININDIKDEKLKKQIQKFGTKDNERGVHYNTASEVSKLFSDSNDVKEFFEKNKEAIKQGKITENDFDFSVSKSTDANTKILNKIDRHTSIQHGKITDMKIDDKGIGTGKLIDRSDYEKREPQSFIDLNAAINNHGYNMQEKGNYENYFSIIDILSKTENKQEVLDLLEKLKKYFRY